MALWQARSAMEMRGGISTFMENLQSIEPRGRFSKALSQWQSGNSDEDHFHWCVGSRKTEVRTSKLPRGEERCQLFRSTNE